MDQLEIAKIQNTINQIENQISKKIDSPNSILLMDRAIYQMKLLLLRIGYLEKMLDSHQETV